MKKAVILSVICLSTIGFAFGQKQTLNKKESKKILEKAWDAVKANDTAAFAKLWIIDKQQWPFHGGQMFTHKDIYDNFLDFRSYFDSAMVKKLKFDEVECDTVEHKDPHYEYAKYYIKAWFKYSPTHSSGFGFYMDYVNNQWLVRFSPDYSDITRKK